MTKEQLTQLEVSVLNALSNQDEYDEMPTSSVENLSDASGIDNKSIRGVLSSLIKKGLVQTTTFANGKTAFQFIYN